MDALHSLGIEVKCGPCPWKCLALFDFNLDESHAAYDGEYAHRFWQILVSVDTVFWEFAHDSLARSAPSISSGAVSIWP